MSIGASSGTLPLAPRRRLPPRLLLLPPPSLLLLPLPLLLSGPLLLFALLPLQMLLLPVAWEDIKTATSRKLPLLLQMLLLLMPLPLLLLLKWLDEAVTLHFNDSTSKILM